MDESSKTASSAEPVNWLVALVFWVEFFKTSLIVQAPAPDVALSLGVTASSIFKYDFGGVSCGGAID